MDAMGFECLLRSCYQVGRFGKEGVDAAEYRRLEYAERNYKTELEKSQNKSANQVDDFLIEYNMLCRKIWRFTSDAIREGICKHRDKFSESEIKDLEDYIAERISITKDDIDKAIEKAQTIFVTHKIYPA